MADPVSLDLPKKDPVANVLGTAVPSITPGYVRSKFEDSARAMRYEQYSYVRNLSFLDGQQWVYWDKQRNILQEFPRQGTRARITVNKLRPTMRELMARLLSKPLQFQVPPGDSDDASIRGAHLAEAILEDLRVEHDWENIREESLMATLLGGTAILSVDWNPKKGTTIGHLPITGQEFGTGEIEGNLHSIAEVAWEPGTVDPEHGNWWIRAQVLPPETVRERYNLNYTPAADATSITTPLSHIASRTQRESGPQKLTLVLTYYERPNSLRKQGVICTAVDGKFVESPKPWYFPFKDRLNITIMRETKVPRQGTGKTVFSDAVGLQTALNACWSNLIEHMKNAGNMRLMAPDTALDGIEDLSDLPGEFLLYNANSGGKPEYLSPGAMPQWWSDMPMKISAEIDNVLGLHDISRGISPGVDSGVAIGMLIEQDQTPLGKLTSESARAFEKFATMTLEIYKQFVKEPRQSYVSHGQIAECVEWDGKALQGQLKPIIPMAAIMPRSKAAAQQLANTMVQMKLITTVEEYLEVSEQPNSDALITKLNADVAKARRENALMAQGVPCVPADFDDHAKHMKEHNDFRKTARYESLTSDERKLVDMHQQAHENLAAEQMGTMVAKANAHPALPAIPTANGSAPLPPTMPGAVPPPGAAPMPMTPDQETPQDQAQEHMGEPPQELAG